MATNDSQTSASPSLYVGDLANEVNEPLLFEIFNAVGPVSSIRVCRDAVTGRSLGYAYVNFHKMADAKQALETLNFTQIANRSCRIMWSQRDPSLRKSGKGNVFVKNLDHSIDHKALYDTFSVFGKILSCKVVMNREGESLGYGFVHFDTDEDAAKAIENVNGMMIAGKEVVVAQFEPRVNRKDGEATVFTNIFVKNLPEDYTKDQLDELFSKHGKITSSSLATDAEGKSKCFGFVNFDTMEEAKAAIEKLNGLEMEGKELFVGRAMKRENRDKLLREQKEKERAEREKQWAGCNLYVKNLADTVDEEKLNETFKKHGEVVSTRVMKDTNGKSRGFGFVLFKSPEEAQAALDSLNGELLEEKPLYIAHFQNKDIRRQQLDAQFSRRVGGGAQMPMYAQPMFYGGPQAMQPGPMYPGAMTQGMPQPMMGGQWPQGANARQPAYPMGAPQAQPSRANRQPRSARPAPAKQQVPAVGNGPQQLTLQALAAAPKEEQRQMIGERLFPLIYALQPERAGKITGMLLEMDHSDLLELLETPESLREKVDEAVGVLDAHTQTA